MHYRVRQWGLTPLVPIATTISKGKDKQFVVSGWKLVSTGSMPQIETPNLNALSDVDVAIIQKEIAEIKRAAKDCSKVIDENGEPLPGTAVGSDHIGMYSTTDMIS